MGGRDNKKNCRSYTEGSVIVLDTEIKKENEKKKEYLYRYIAATKQLKRYEDDLKEIRNSRLSPPAISNSGLPTGSNQTDLSDYAVKLDKAINKVLKQKYRRIKIRMKIRDKIERMESEKEKELLTYKYINNMDWNSICLKMGYSWQHVHRIHASALKNFKM